ncbi:MAG: TolC family protein [Verrucomicrobiales bacterium]|nr:TolC family protein [Verrucomicrobiales bacterium]
MTISRWKGFWLGLGVALGNWIGAPFARSAETGDLGPREPARDAPVVTLNVLVSETLESNPELRYYRAEVEAAKGWRRDAARLANPEVTGSFGPKSVRGGSVTEEGIAWSVGLQQPLEWPGRLSLRKAIANRDVELAELGLARFQVELATRVRGLGYRLLAAQELASAAAEVAQRFHDLREVLVQRDPAGLTPLLETRVIEATELNAQRKSADAALQVESATLELNRLRGVAATNRWLLGPTPLDFRPLVDREAALAAARTNDFELRARMVELVQQGFRVDLARNERYPGVSVGLTVSEESAGDRERIIGLSVSVPLPMWQRNSGAVAAARARETQAEVSLEVARRESERKVLDAAVRYASKVAEMGRWRPDAVRHFREAAEIADRHYRLGSVPISTYVELQKQYLDAVETLLTTKQEALEAAAQLESLTGMAWVTLEVSVRDGEVVP